MLLPEDEAAIEVAPVVGALTVWLLSAEAPPFAIVVVAVLVVLGSLFGEVGGAEEEEELAEEEAEDREEAFVEELVDDTFLADSAALLRTIRLIDDTEGRLSSSQIPSDCNWFLISQANMVGFAFL